MLTRCPECRHKVSDSAKSCPSCGFSFDPQDLERYKQQLERLREHKKEVNRKSAKLQLIWLLIFVVFIAVATWVTS
ncbi:zinc ribbon domain-containing protein [Testudinibacter sp. TR-2022]|uniref:zinc ribbon domain-containing protein n=1 Tax=Testudinibacter sp. TR-2022 TaxID=2585029 RepID=UPI001117BD7D|nr:zinc ribbon domain-containing protein [Testudinibacter sp. TR-2022]TNG93265.1 zinc ribbon domain-containing protein [Pasteurellaceae bacterium UScroc12]TNG97061.1 zinc ribbon domain-containing protein [Pasteurellaceae bacterium UScroc31]TNG97410.1 zinc ribbon domain-containing protein [Pasteurellaceae bacterium USgator41]TNH00722.1 zinc ribbon domain-containing protein [Pasteurellaceae bacterium USgator11]TNH03410.1 zinc ribbon domain-containing protein [Pasteurellaceae bacterium Phil31]TN